MSAGTLFFVIVGVCFASANVVKLLTYIDSPEPPLDPRCSGHGF